MSRSFSHKQYLHIALSSPTPKALRTREVPQKRLGPQVTSLTAQTPLSFPCPLAHFVNLAKKVIMSGCFTKGSGTFQSRQEAPCCSETLLVAREHPLMDKP